MEYDTELYHHGILGMKWGIRRYQNKDGSLTNAGKKHRASTENSSPKKTVSKNTTKSSAKSSAKGGSKTVSKKNAKPNVEETPKKKTVSEMTDSELRDHINRMRLESEYFNAQKTLAAMNPKQVSKGQRFVNSMVNDVIAPAAKNAGRAYLEKVMKDKLGLNQDDPITRLEKQAKKLRLTKEIEDLKKGKSDNGYSLDEVLETYRNIPESTRKELAEAAKIQENLNKVNKKKNNN